MTISILLLEINLNLFINPKILLENDREWKVIVSAVSRLNNSLGRGRIGNFLLFFKSGVCEETI